MRRRRFDHLFTEIALASGQRISRYQLWLHLHHLGCDPELLSREAAIAFCDEPLTEFLADRGIRLGPRRQRRLLRNVERYDPLVPTPEETFARDYDLG